MYRFLKNKIILETSLVLFFIFCFSFPASALSPGTLLYRTSGSGLMYGYSSRELLGIKRGILQHIYPGHVGMYIGEEDGIHYVVEALAGGIVKTRAEHFVNEAADEKFIGAKIPKEANFSIRLKAVKIAKALAEKNLGYDFSFQKQKGPNNSDWTCVGLVEKIYESAGILNPNNLDELVYDSDNYAIDITPDGFDNISFINSEGDCFSSKREFSKIAARKNLILPPPEKIGFNAGRLYKGERYFFVPYTQFLQTSLKNEKVDIKLSSSFREKDIRGKTPTLGLMLRWSLVNNPLSSIKAIADNTISAVRKYTKKIFGKNEDSLSLDSFDLLEDDSVIAKQSNDSYTIVNKSNEGQNGSVGEAREEHDIILINEDVNNEASTPHNSKIVAGGDKQIVEAKNNKGTVADNDLNINTDKANQDSGVSLKTKSPDKSALVVLKQDALSKEKIEIEKKPAKPSAGSLKLADSKIKIGTKPEEAVKPGEENSSNNSGGTPSAYISKVYSTGMNDFIELYNPNDFDFDLAEAGFRIEKTKTADNPSIVMRIGNESDGIYPGGTVIKAKSYYLMVRDGASPYFLNLADAIGKRREFGWTGNGYTLYLGKAAISSSDDADILDALGFGAATYYQGTQPAPEISDNYYLNRVAFDNDNYTDFSLVASSDPSISWDDYIDQGDGGDNNQEPGGEGGSEDGSASGEDGDAGSGGNEGGDNNNGASDFSPFVFPGTIEASHISHLWHFDECYGEQDYTVGIFDCALSVSYSSPEFIKELDPEIDLNKFSLSFYYRDHSLNKKNQPRIRLKLSNDNDHLVEVLLEKNLMQITGLPNTLWRYYKTPVFSEDDYNWRHFALVVDKEAGYWATYINGVEICRHEFIESLPSNFNLLQINDDTGLASIDELVFWSEALSSSDINQIIDSRAPFEPYPKRTSQKYPALKYFWNFNEGHEKVNEGGGNEALDEVEGLLMNLPEDSWIWKDSNNTGIKNKWGKDIDLSLSSALSSSDMSLAFWWRSSFYPNDGRSRVGLYFNDKPKFVLTPSYYRRNYWFNDKEGLFSDGENTDFSKDEAWHHFIMTYDSYRYELKLYIDGQIKKTLENIWIAENELPNRLLIKNELNYVELDDLAIFEGTLSAIQAAKLYQGTLIDK